jgi:hypothetical protein
VLVLTLLLPPGDFTFDPVFWSPHAARPTQAIPRGTALIASYGKAPSLSRCFSDRTPGWLTVGWGRLFQNESDQQALWFRIFFSIRTGCLKVKAFQP